MRTSIAKITLLTALGACLALGRGTSFATDEIVASPTTLKTYEPVRIAWVPKENASFISAYDSTNNRVAKRKVRPELLASFFFFFEMPGTYTFKLEDVAGSALLTTPAVTVLGQAPTYVVDIRTEFVGSTVWVKLTSNTDQKLVGNYICVYNSSHKSVIYDADHPHAEDRFLVKDNGPLYSVPVALDGGEVYTVTLEDASGKVLGSSGPVDRSY